VNGTLYPNPPLVNKRRETGSARGSGGFVALNCREICGALKTYMDIYRVNSGESFVTLVDSLLSRLFIRVSEYSK